MTGPLKKALFILSVGSFSVLAFLVLKNLDLKSSSSDTNSDGLTSCSELTVDNLTSDRALGLIIQDRKLLALRLDGEDNYSPPGGNIELSESPEEALLSELYEELGVRVKPEELEPYHIACYSKKDNSEIFRSQYYLVKKADLSLNITSNDRLQFVDFEFSNQKRADDDLRQILVYLKNAKLID